MSILYPFSSRCARLVGNPPGIGRNRHNWLFRVAAHLRANGWKLAKIEELLHAICRERGWTDRDGKTIADIMAKLAEPLSPESVLQPRLPPWPTPVPSARRARFDRPSLFNPHGDTGLTPVDVLPVLFPGDPLVCFGWTERHYSTMPLSDLLPHAHTAPFIVANPMIAERSETGSKRCKAIASRPEDRRFLVIEFDTHETRAEQAAVLSSLHSPTAPLVMAVWSAGKSIHGWFDVTRLPPYYKLRLFRFAVWLGADESLFDMSKLVRMPGGSRAGARQTILHFQPRETAP